MNIESDTFGGTQEERNSRSKPYPIEEVEWRLWNLPDKEEETPEEGSARARRVVEEYGSVDDYLTAHERYRREKRRARRQALLGDNPPLPEKWPDRDFLGYIVVACDETITLDPQKCREFPLYPPAFELLKDPDYVRYVRLYGIYARLWSEAEIRLDEHTIPAKLKHKGDLTEELGARADAEKNIMNQAIEEGEIRTEQQLRDYVFNALIARAVRLDYEKNPDAWFDQQN